MAVTTRRKPAPVPAPDLAAVEARLAVLEAENTALARGLCRLIVMVLPGGPATAQQILAQQLRLGLADADTIIAAAQRQR